MNKAWRMVCKMKDWQDSSPHLIKLWQATLVIPCNMISCERGFSKQNLIKEIKRNQLNIEHLDDLMRVSLNGPQITFLRVFFSQTVAKILEYRSYNKQC
jgi:hypothetical protein